MTTWATENEIRERFLATTCEFVPADPGDTRFEVGEFEGGMEETPYWLRMIDDQGEQIEMHFFATPVERSEMIASFRYSQAVPFEEEFAPFGPAWEREQVRS